MKNKTDNATSKMSLQDGEMVVGTDNNIYNNGDRVPLSLRLQLLLHLRFERVLQVVQEIGRRKPYMDFRQQWGSGVALTMGAPLLAEILRPLLSLIHI